MVTIFPANKWEKDKEWKLGKCGFCKEEMELYWVCKKCGSMRKM